MRLIWKRLLAAGLAAAILVTPVAKADTLVPDQESIMDATLASITSSAGTIDRKVSPDREFYDLILGKDEESFALKVVPSENAASIRPQILIGELVGATSVFSNSYELKSGEYSQDYTLAPGEYRVFQILVTARGLPDNPQSYTVRAYRTPNEVVMQRSIKTMPDGSRQLKVEMMVTPGAKLQSIILGLRFDTKTLKIADRTTNKVINSPDYRKDITYAPDLLYGTAAPGTPAGVMVPATSGSLVLDNTSGKIGVQLGMETSAMVRVKNYYEVLDTSGPIMTFYFRIMSDTAGVGSSAISFLENTLYKLGCRLSERAVKQGTDNTSYFAAQGPGYAKFSGEERTITLPKLSYLGGRVVVMPDGQSMGGALGYCYGDTVTLTAVPNTGYRFAYWDTAGGATLTEEERTAESLSFRLLENIDVSYLVPIFKETEISLPTGAELSFESPYLGGQLMIYNPLGESSKQPDGSFSKLEVLNETMAENLMDIEGSTRIAEEPNEDELARVEVQDGIYLPEHEAERVELYADELQTTPVLGEERAFQARDTRYDTAPQIVAGAWTSVPFSLKAIRESNGVNIYVWLAADPDWQPMEITDEQIEVLADSFITSFTTLTQKYHKVSDSNNNGGLDILLYDIRDQFTYGNSSYGYIGGLINVSELYNSFKGLENGGNLGDVLHLDTYPQLRTGGAGYTVTQRGLETAMSTMAHETQHLAMGSVFTRGTEYTDNAPSTWINEGISMLIEQELFGPLSDRITTYNKSAAIKQGLDFTLGANWEKTNSLSCYSMSYLFFAYISAQAQDDTFATKFYTSYGSGANKEKKLEAIVQEIPAFQGMQLSEVFKRFYLALCLKEPDGIYGFKGASAFQGLNPPVYDALPSAELASGGAVYVKSSGYFTPDTANGLQYVGIKTTQGYGVTTSVEPQDGGKAEVSYDQTSGTAEVTATAAQDYIFVGWKVDGQEIDGENPLIVTLDANKNVTACFSKTPCYRLTINCDSLISADGIKNEIIQVVGEDNVPIANTNRIPEGTTVKVLLQPSKYCTYRFDGWEGAASGGSTAITLNMNSDKSLTANLQITGWLLTILNQNPDCGTFVVEGENGETISPQTTGGTDYMLSPNSTVTLRAIANNGYICEGWGSDPSGAHKLFVDNRYAYNLKFREIELVALSNLIRFQGESDELQPELDKNTITLPGQGSVVFTPMGGAVETDGQVWETTTIRATAIPAEGRVFNQWVAVKNGVVLNAQEAMQQGLYTIVEENRSALPEEDEISAARTIEFRANKNVSMEAQFIDKKAGELRLSSLSVVAPKSRQILQSGDSTQGFNESVFDYTLSLLSTEENIALTAVRQTAGVTSAAVLRQLRGGQLVGDEIEIEDRSTDEAPQNNAINLNVRDGDIIEILVWDGTANREVNQRYRITVDLRSKDEDPLVIATFLQKNLELAPQIWTLELSADNMQAESLQTTIFIKKGAVKPVDKNGVAIEFGSESTLDLTHYCDAVAGSGYEVATATMTRSATEEYDRLNLTVKKLKEDAAPPVLAQLTYILTMRFEKQSGTDATWLKPNGEGNMLDRNLLAVDSIEILVIDNPMLSGVFTVAGSAELPTITIKNSESGETLANSNLFVQLAGQEGDGAYIVQFRVLQIDPGTYDLTIEKPGYTKVELKEIIIDRGNVVTDLNSHSDERLHRLKLYAGKLDENEAVTMNDWALLAYSGLLGRKVSEVDPKYANYDLDDNGIIQVADLELLTKLKCLGKESISITVAPAQR